MLEHQSIDNPQKANSVKALSFQCPKDLKENLDTHIYAYYLLETVHRPAVSRVKTAEWLGKVAGQL